MDWSKYPNFNKDEFTCKHTGKNEMQESFIARLQKIRNRFGKPMWVTSGYRDPSHPIEAAKKASGVHSTGRACDIGVQGADAFTLLKIALEEGMIGIGIKQEGAGRFIHLDDVENSDRFPRPRVWSY